MNEQEKNELLQRIAALENRCNNLESTVETVKKFMSAITESQSIETTMNEIESVTKQLTNCDNATFYCFDSTEGKFFSSSDSREWQDRSADTDIMTAFTSQKINNKKTEAIIPLVNDKGTSMGVIVAEKAAGFDKKDFGSFGKGCQIASTVELAFQKETEHQGRVTDELTSLKNRQGLNEYLKNTVCGNINEGRNVSILMLDIDHFKNINDTYGHDAGDAILKGVSDILTEFTRNGADCACRMGGEEMICILNCPPEKAVDIAERLRAQVENTVHHVTDEKGKPYDVKVTVSIGIAEMKPQEEMNKSNARRIFDGEFKKADTAVYKAKNTGRNKIVCADTDVYKAYLTHKAAELLCTDCPEKTPIMESKIGEYLNSGGAEGINTVIDAVQNVSEKHFELSPEIDSLTAQIESVYAPPPASQQEIRQPAPAAETVRQAAPAIPAAPAADVEIKYFNKAAYSKIQNKEYLNVPATVAYKISKMAQAANILHSVKYAGDKSTVTVDGVRDKAFVDEVKRTFMRDLPARNDTPENTPPQTFAYDSAPEDFSYLDTSPDMPPQTFAYDSAPEDFSYLNAPPDMPPQTFAYDTAPEEFPVSDIPAEAPPQPNPHKPPTYFNKEGYKGIGNKTFIDTDSKTAYAISKEAQRRGIEHSVKYDGKHSAVTLDGVKHRGFIETVKRMSEWADKVQIKAAKFQEQEQNRKKGAR